MDDTPEGSLVEDEPELLEAKEIFLLMKKEHRLSRNTRAHWYFSNLNSVIRVTNGQSLAEFTGDINVVSVVPEEPVPPDWDSDTCHLYKYHVSSQTMVTFLSQQYRFVYLLDFSPSSSSIDVVKGNVLLDQMLSGLKRSLEGVIRPFYVPGSQLLFRPDIYVTVIAWTPFLCSGAHKVLHQGWLLSPDNITSFLAGVSSGLDVIEEQVSQMAAIVIDELETIKLQSENVVGALFEETLSSPMTPSIPMAAPDTGFVNMIYTGMLSLQLLPDNSSAGIIVITDGVISIPDINIFDVLLNQLRTKSISLSFLQTSSAYHPHTGLGYNPYPEMMEFMSLATSGSFLARIPEIEPSEPYVYEMNIYHEAFLSWSFRKILEGVRPKPVIEFEKDLRRKGNNYSEIRNPFFIKAAEEELIYKKKMDHAVNTNLTSILSCRLREGYTVNTVIQNDHEIKVKLTLPWKYHTFIHYTIWSSWPPNSGPECHKCRVEVAVEGPYDILYDLISQKDMQFQSHYRMSVIRKFYATLQLLTQTDKLLVHLHSFTSNQAHYTIPDTNRSGMPLFSLVPGSGEITLMVQDYPHHIFATFWKPVCSLDMSIWHRWMHTHRIGLLLQHDHPLPKYLLMSCQTGRYYQVLCRKAASKIYDLLKDWSEFILLENHSYIRFIRDNDGMPTSFYVIRVASKPPCLVVWLAFLGGILGSTRHQIVQELTEKIENLTITQRVCWKDIPMSKIKLVDSEDEDDGSSSEAGGVKHHNSLYSEVYACVMLSKPVEKILIRYDKMPTDFYSVLGNLGPFPSRSYSPVGFRGPDGQRQSRSAPKSASVAFLTLSRYLCHQRCIWSVQSSTSVSVSTQSVARILNTLCKMRIHEGFSFAHSSNGIQNLVLELPTTGSSEGDGQSCVVQYVIFPPHTTTSSMKDSLSEEDLMEALQEDHEMAEADGEVQIITEFWTEPQSGIVLSSDSHLEFLNSSSHKDIAARFFPRDLECISTLITFEHLSLMCQNDAVPSPPPTSCLPELNHFSRHETTNTSRDHSSPRLIPLTSNTTIQIPFAFDLMSLLPKSHQTELLFSLFIQDLQSNPQGVPYAWYPGHKPLGDRPNELLLEHLFKQLETISDREVHLSSRENKMLPELLRNRRSSQSKFQIPVTGDFKLYESQPCSLNTLPSHPSTLSTKPRDVNAGSFSRRNPSGNSVSSSMTENYNSDNLAFGNRDPEVDPLGLYPKWRCFMKAISTTHLVLTILPATYQDLKLLTLNEDTLQGHEPDVVAVVEKPMDLPSNTDQNVLDGFSIDSSISNLEMMGTDFGDVSSTFSEDPIYSFRQKSGSDAGDRIKPKLPTIRKASGGVSAEALMRNRTASDGFPDVKSKSCLKDMNMTREANDRNRCLSMDSKQSLGQQSRNFHSRSKTMSGPHENIKLKKLSACSTPKSSIKTTAPSIPGTYGSMTLPIYVYDCNITGLTNALLFKEFKDRVSKPKNNCQNHLFRHENVTKKQESKHKSTDSLTVTSAVDEEAKTPEPEPIHLAHDPQESIVSLEKEIKQQCQILQMTYFKSYVSTLFRCLQVNLPVHSYDVEHALNYCEHESSLDLELYSFIQAVCPHNDTVTKDSNDKTISKNDSQLYSVETREVLDMEKIKLASSCIKQNHLHKNIQSKFQEIIQAQFRLVPSHPNVFFFCPPGLWDRPGLDEIDGIGSSRRRKETSTSVSGGTAKNHNSGGSSGNKVDGWEEVNIEFKNEPSESGQKSQKDDCLSDIDVETAAMDGHSNMSVLSNLETESDLDEMDEDKDDTSPPLFFQLSFSISQNNEDIVSAPVNDLPTCFTEILQSPSIPDPEQDMDVSTLGLRLDLVCMTLPVEMGTMPPNIGLRITSLCSSTSYRDSLTMPDNDSVSSMSSIEEDIDSGSDGLAHLPEYQHRAVMNVLGDVKWMLRDEIAFAASKKEPMTKTTLEFVSKHVSSSVGKPGSLVESVDLQFVFGIDQSLKEFNEKIKVMQLTGFELNEESGFYYLALKKLDSCENDIVLDTANDEIIDGKESDDYFISSRRSKQRHSRQLQLSPVKETSLSNQTSVDVDQPIDSEEKLSLGSAADSSELSDLSDSNIVKVVRDHKQEHVNFINNFDVILQVNKDRVTLFVHFRDNNPTASATWKLVNAEIVDNIKNICTTVNQSLLLQDLYNTRLCNWLLEPETNEDWRDPSRQLSNDDSFEAPYLEANLNMNFRPGRFSCPEVWETSFHLHPRLKQGQNPHTHSRGMQALRSVLLAFLVTNRSDMFVYQDDKKNIFYLKLYENQQGRYNLLSRQSSYAQMKEEETLSRSSSIGSSRQLQRTPKQSGSFQRQVGVPVDHDELGSYSRSNSVTEYDRKPDENTIILKVHGIEEAGPNIKQDLVAVLQKKLDEKVVEVISMMLQRNVRCKLASEDVIFLQKPMSPPSSVLQFSVHVNSIQYLHAVSYYLRQNMLRIPLIVPNYTPGSTHFKDYSTACDPSSGESIAAEENSSQLARNDLNDVFLYNEHNAVGDSKFHKFHDSHKGIGCIALSIVDGQGNLVKHFSYPKPVNLEYLLPSQTHKIDMVEMQELTTTSVYKRDEKEADKSPGPIALIQFRIWESGRVDLEKVTDLLQCAIRHALWDALLEYKMLPVPLTQRTGVHELDSLSMVVDKPLSQLDDTPSRSVHCKSTKLSLDSLGEAAGSIKLLSTYSASSSPINIESSPNQENKLPINTPEIVIEATDLVDSPLQKELNCFEQGHQGSLNTMYHSGVQDWFEFGLQLGPNGVPSMHKHSIKLIAKHSLHIILKEIQQQIGSVIPDLDTRVYQRFQTGDSNDMYIPCSKLLSRLDGKNDTSYLNSDDEAYIIVGRNMSHWKACTQEEVIHKDRVITKSVQSYQNFHPLFLSTLQSGLDNHVALSPSVMTLTSTPNPTLGQSVNFSTMSNTTPGTPSTPCIASSGLAGIIGTMNTSSPVFVPRQRLLITMLSKKEIVTYFYNVSRDCQERMVKQTSNLGHWFTARSSLVNSIVLQKMGLFHNQDFYREESMCNNPFIGNSSYVDSLVKHHAPPNTLDALSKSKQAQIAFREVFRDNKPEKPIHKTKYNAEKDALGKHGKQMLNVWGLEQRDLKNRLYDMWQSRGETFVYSEDLITYFKQKARLIHYIFTPLLFLPKWRWQAQLTRNHGVQAMDFLPAENKRHSSVSMTGEMIMDHNKSRHGSDGSAKLTEPRSKTLSAKTSLVSMGNKSPANSPKLQVRSTQTEWFHCELVSHYIQEYIQYLQTLGFMLIEPKSSVHRRRPTGGDKSHEEVYHRKRHRTGTPRVSYLQKSLPAGLLIFEIGVLEPFFYTKLLAMEEARIQMKISQTVASKNYKVNFIDECDRNKTLIHLHSFTYDYHLRTIHNYIAQKNPSNIRKGFHLTSFLDDFMKYYNKSPNYARNLIHAGVLHIPTNAVTPAQMFNYLLSHEKQYRMNVIRMEPVYIDSDTEFDNEYVLTQLSSHNITYNTDNDHPDHRRKDDFDVTLILSHDICHQDKKVLTLKYFVVMSSKRELYPMKGQWSTLGKFRTVTTQQGVKDGSKASSAPRATPETISQGRRPSGQEGQERESESREATPEGVAWEETTLKSHILGKLGGIRQESVNYIGYYSEHEETMKNVIMAQASNAEERISETVSLAIIDCRRDQLWQKLLLCRGPKDPAAQLSYHEFTELITLVHHETLDKVDPQLVPLLTKSNAWFTALAHTMVTKYGDLCRQFVSSDGKVHHTVVLNESYMDTFALVSVDNSTKEGTLNIVYKENKANNNFMPFVYTLIEGFVESCCFHLYSQLL